MTKDKKEKDSKINIASKMTSKRILRPNKMEVRIPDYHAPSILNDPNRFFSSEMEETKKSLFFS